MEGLFVGLATLDVAQYADRLPAPDEKVTSRRATISAGGPAANAAVTFAALGGRATLVTLIGHGDAAALVRADLERHGVRVVDLAPPGQPGPSAVSAIVVTGAGRAIVGSDAAPAPAPGPAPAPDAALALPPDLLAAATTCDVLLADGHHPALALPLTRAACRAGRPVVVDVGRWKPVFADLAALPLELVCSEAVRAPGTRTPEESARALLAAGAAAVVATAGAAPVRWWLPGTDAALVRGVSPVPAVEVRDTLGAGDALHGAYAYARAAGRSIPQAVAAGVRAASVRVQVEGPRAWLSGLRPATDADTGARATGSRSRPAARTHRPAPSPVPITLAELVSRAAALAGDAERDGRRRILGIAGEPGAGKSHLARAIGEALGARRCAVVGMDGFHLSDAVLRALGRRERKGAPDTFDAAGYVALLARLAAQHAGLPDDVAHPAARLAGVDGHLAPGPDAVAHPAARPPGPVPPAPAPDPVACWDPELAGVVLAPRYERDVEEAIAGSVLVRPEVPLVVTEGNYLLLDIEPWSRVPAFTDVVWYLAPQEELRRERLVARHVAHGKSPAAARAWALGTDERNARLIAATAHRADAVWRILEPPAPTS